MSRFLDKLHKTAVTCLMGLTVGTGVILSMQVYEFVNRPRSGRPPNATTAISDSTQTTEGENLENSNFIAMAVSCIYSRLCYVTRSSLQSYPPIFRHKTTWNILRVNHIAVATSDLEKSMKFYKDILGAKVSGGVPMPDHGVTTAFVELSNTQVELVSPLGARSPVRAFLERQGGGGMHHLCLEVDDIGRAAADLRERGVRTLAPEPRAGAHGKPVLFLHPKDCGGVLIELQEA